jgi:hypothetical protein
MKRPKEFNKLTEHYRAIKFHQKIFVPFGKSFTERICKTIKTRRDFIDLAEYWEVLHEELDKFFIKESLGEDVYKRMFDAFDKQNLDLSTGYVSGIEALWIIHDAMTNAAEYYLFGDNAVCLYDIFFPEVK